MFPNLPVHTSITSKVKITAIRQFLQRFFKIFSHFFFFNISKSLTDFFYQNSQKFNGLKAIFMVKLLNRVTDTNEQLHLWGKAPRNGRLTRHAVFRNSSSFCPEAFCASRSARMKRNGDRHEPVRAKAHTFLLKSRLTAAKKGGNHVNARRNQQSRRDSAEAQL